MSLRKGLFAALALISAPIAAQAPNVEAAIAAGQVGERYDGYMGFTVQPAEQLRRQVTAINIRRRSLYAELAGQRGVTAQLVGLTTACALLRQIPAGGAYMLNDNIWRRRAPGQPVALPESCR
jgi:uncharacterized protein YdbL (DUF1318 family)